MGEIHCQCEASKDNNCKTTLAVKKEGNYLYLVIKAPHISSEQYGGQLGIFVKPIELDSILKDVV